MIKNSLAALTALLLAAAAFTPGAAPAGEKGLTVVELFTSQGCSSCPPADKLLGELSERDDVLALSEHVDYWDYIGWKDTFALPANGARQRGYAAQFQLRYVYTPQMVVGGAYQAVGSNRAEIEDMIRKAQAAPRVDIALKRTAEGAEVVLPAHAVDDTVEVVAVFYDRAHATKIKRGENRGNTLTYRNVVRKMMPVALWRGEARRIPIALPKSLGEVCAVLLQTKATRRIIGAARIALSGT